MKQFIQNDNNFAITYLRYSSRGQNEASIDQQREMAEKYANDHGLTIVKEYADAALTGTEAKNRPQYQLMLREIKQIKPANKNEYIYIRFFIYLSFLHHLPIFF